MKRGLHGTTTRRTLAATARPSANLVLFSRYARIMSLRHAVLCQAEVSTECGQKPTLLQPRRKKSCKPDVNTDFGSPQIYNMGRAKPADAHQRRPCIAEAQHWRNSEADGCPPYGDAFSDVCTAAVFSLILTTATPSAAITPCPLDNTNSGLISAS